MDYEMEEILPLVSELAQKYGGYESTSVTYEKAQMLMGAVLYCLEEYHNAQTVGLVTKNIGIREQYKEGARLLYEKAENIQKVFHELSFYFEDYGVECLRDTVQKGIPQFLKWYDVKYNPQETIITLDYPLLFDYHSLSGADAVYRYILGIQAEQRFLGGFDKGYVVSVLEKYNPQYKYMIENICEVILGNTIGHVFIKKPLDQVDFQWEDYLQFEKLFEGKTVGDIEKMTENVIREITKKFFENDMDVIFEYLCCGIRNIAVRLEAAKRFHNFQKIFLV